MATSEMITLRVGSDTKRKMDQLGPDLNWSEELRALLLKKLRQLAYERALKLSAEANRGLPPLPRGSVSKMIREDRDAN